MTTKTQLLNVLSRHQGREAGINAKELAQLLGLSPRKLRLLVSEAREEGIAICGKPNTGYFIAQTPEELNESCAFLQHRALKSLLLLSRMKKVSLPTLMGQLLLNKA